MMDMKLVRTKKSPRVEIFLILDIVVNKEWEKIL